MADKFRHPEEGSDQCKVCVCCEDGKFTCTQRVCTVPQCGVNMQVRDEEDCCTVCKPACNNVSCQPNLDCPLSRQAFQPNSCCRSCGCEVLPQDFPISPVAVGTYKLIYLKCT